MSSKSTSDGSDQLEALVRELDSKSGLRIAASTAESRLVVLLNSFSPEATPHKRSLGFLVLSKLVSNARPKDPAGASERAQQDATANLVRLLSPLLLPRLSSTESADVMPACGLLAALFQVDQSTACQILLTDGLMESVMDATDLFEGEQGLEVCRGVASLLSQASGSKSCRSVVISHAVAWLQSQSKQTSDPTLRAAAAIALTKLSRGTEEDNSADVSLSGSSESAVEAKPDTEGLVSLMKRLVIDSLSTTQPDSPDLSTPQATLDAVEGLAYMTSDPRIRETLSSDAIFLARLFALIPAARKRQTGPVPIINSDSTDFDSPQRLRSSFGLLYGIAVIVSNIVAYQPQLTEEEKQVEKLKKMTQAGAQTGRKLSDEKDSLDALRDDVAVRRRCKRLLKAGALPALVSIASRSESESVRRASGRAFLSLVEDKENRGKVVQSGGARALLSIIRASFTSIEGQPTAPAPAKGRFDSTSTQPTRALDAQDLPAIQALAKLSITSSPLLLFGPDASSSIDAVRPLGHLLLNPSSNLLQKFEALMALTNLGSLGPVVASRIAVYKEPGLGSILSKTETLMLDDNVLVRRAAMELVCNLVSSDEVWERYTGERSDGDRPAGPGDDQLASASSKGRISRLRIVLALSDVNDAGTRLAASGALAMLTSSENVCRAMMGEMEDGPGKTFAVLVDLITPPAPDTDDEAEEDGPLRPDLRPQLAHRGVVCVRNMIANVSSGNSQSKAIPAIVEAAEKTGLVGALVTVLTSPVSAGNREVVTAAAQALKWLTDHGIKLPTR